MKQLVIETHNGSVSVEVHDQYGSIVNGKLYHSNESIINMIGYFRFRNIKKL